MSKTIYLKVHYVEKRKVQEREYGIAIVPNKFNRDYPEYFKRHAEVLRYVKKLNAAKTEAELKYIEAEIKKLDMETTLNMKYNLIKTIMVANDYDFDQEWWDIRVDPGDIDDFIGACVQKDMSEGKKKELLKTLGF